MSELYGFLTSGMGCMTFLPKEFACANKRSRVLEFPTNNICPLVQFQRQISMRLNPLSETRVHNSLTSRPDSNWLSQIALATLSDPGNFRWKAFNVVLFLIKGCFWHKHGEVAILNTHFLNARVKETCDLFPNKERRRAQNVASWNVVIFDKSWLRNDLRVPLWEIFFLRIFNTKLMHVCFFLDL